jgi:stage II sporulation protein M
LFCIALAFFSTSAFGFSKRMFIVTASKNAPAASVREGLLRLSSRLLTALIIAFAASLIDTLLWSLFAGAFKF